MMQWEALICCLNLQEHIILIITIRTSKTKTKKSTDDETKSDLKLEDLYNNSQMFLGNVGLFLCEGDQGSYNQVSEVQSNHN